MSKLSIFLKKLLFQIKEEIVMIDPVVNGKIQNKVIHQKRITKHQLVKNHLIEESKIDSWTAIKLYGATRLSSIIFNLRKEGYDIKSIPCSAFDRNNNNCNFTTYTFKK